MAEEINSHTAWLLDGVLKKLVSNNTDTMSETIGVVSSVERDGTIFVSLPGSTETTPVNGSVLSNVSAGDIVRIKVADGRLSILGNASSPAVGGTYVKQEIRPVDEKASSALDEANRATSAADIAEQEAVRAAGAASIAQTAANLAEAEAIVAHSAANEAKASAQGAQADATDAKSAAATANANALSAGRSLSDVERVVGTLNWISEHGRYVSQQGEAFDSSKVYYTRSGSGTSADPYVYTVVAEPVAEDIGTYYVLAVDESVQAYIASHLWLDSYGLNLAVDGAGGWHIHQGTLDGTRAMGTYVIDPTGGIVASFGAFGAQVGRSTNVHSAMGADGFSVADGDGTKAFDISGVSQTTTTIWRNLASFTTPSSETGEDEAIGESIVNPAGQLLPLYNVPPEYDPATVTFRVERNGQECSVLQIAPSFSDVFPSSLMSVTLAYQVGQSNEKLLPSTTYNVQIGLPTIDWTSNPVVTIGNDEKSHALIDYHSMQLIDKDENTYFHVSDLRDAGGYITEMFVGDGSTANYTVAADILSVSYIRIDDVEVTNYSINDNRFTIHYPLPSSGSIVAIKYEADFDCVHALSASNSISSFEVRHAIKSILSLTVNNIEVSGYSYSGRVIQFETAQTGSILVRYVPLYALATGFTLGARMQNRTIGRFSVVEGVNCEASALCAHAEGENTVASNEYSHAEGFDTTASGQYSHAEGCYSNASELFSHAEGHATEASASFAHAESENNIASGQSSHAEGRFTKASGTASHSEGQSSVASGINSHAQNERTRASKQAQTAIGTYNVEDTSSTTTHPSGTTAYGNYAAIIGNGTSDSNRSNALTVDWSGNVETAGDVTANGRTLTRTRVKGDNESSYRTGDVNLTPANIGAQPAGTYVNGVKGNAESAYRSGNVNLTPANIGAQPAGSYLGTGANTVTGQFTIKSTGINRDATNPGTAQSSTQLIFNDADNERIGVLRVERNTDGRIGIVQGAMSENTSGEEKSAWWRMWVARDGAITYTVPSAANFRSAIGAAASSDRRLKSDIEPLGEDAVEFVRAVEPCVYTINGERQVGLIAQDVHDADTWGTRMAFETEEELDGLDDWERMEDGSPTWKLDYIRLLPPTIAALQSAMGRIDELEKEVEALRAMTRIE